MDMELKGFGALAVQDADKGEVTAIVATLGVVDRDGDVLLPGSFPPSAPVQISEYKHSAILGGAAPVGKGAVTVEGDKAVFRGRYFLTTERGREAFQTVKEIGEEGQWSFGFPKGVKTATMTKEWLTKGARRLIAGLSPIEVSPVLVGAGLGTRTVAAKEAKMEAKIHRVVCDCGRVLGESPESLVFVGKAKELAEVKVAGPRDVRYCKSCARHAVYVPAALLTKPAA